MPVVGLRDIMKLKARFWLVLMTIGVFSCLVLPQVNAETFTIGAKVSESDLDLRDRKLVNFDSGTTVYTEPDYIDYIASIFDGDESTYINQNFGPGHEVMWIELIFHSELDVSTITIKPTIGGGTTNYTLYVNSNGIWSPWFAQKDSTQKTFQINCKIKGIWLELDNGGTNHFYFNDVIIQYTLSESDDEDDEDDSGFDDLFLEPPFIGLLWIIVIIILISSIRRRRANKKEKADVEPEPTEEQPSSPEPDEPQPSEKQKEVGGRFCPNCGKFTVEKGSFCPYCKRSME
jgi:hypothetical protein